MITIEPTPIAPSETFDDLKVAIKETEEPTTTPKKKRGRPPGTKNKPVDTAPASPAEPIFDPILVSELVAIPFDFLAVRRGAFWKLSDEEKKTMGSLGARVATKYLPATIGNYADEISLTLLVGLVISSRYMQDVKEHPRISESEEPVNDPRQGTLFFENQTPSDDNPYRQFIPRV